MLPMQDGEVYTMPYMEQMLFLEIKDKSYNEERGKKVINYVKNFLDETLLFLMLVGKIYLK